MDKIECPNCLTVYNWADVKEPRVTWGRCPKCKCLLDSQGIYVEAEVIEEPTHNPFPRRLLQELAASWDEGWDAHREGSGTREDNPYRQMLHSHDFHPETGEPPC